MEVQLSEERVLRLVPQLTLDDARILVENKKVHLVAGTVGALFTRPKPEEITLSYSELRYEPFWQVTACTHMVYERQRMFTVSASGPEVKQITLLGQQQPTQPQPKGSPTIVLSGVEHCEEDQRLRRMFTGDGTNKQDLERYLSFGSEEVIDLASYSWDGACMPPDTKAGAIIRQVITEIVRPVKAQVIHTENVSVEEIQLFFRPVYAFEYLWAAKNKRVVIECDGLTRDLTNGGKTFKKQIKSLLDRDLLFDISADAVGTFVPGGGIFVKLTKAAMNFKQS
ncbi:hypothetical protein [Paenibacillus sedimenti]|uniref:Uncharacterized protein n=1 Tax=Paenibacillus sedimenti TaxID=2770274 RepID=A0A926QJ19_9BACL|nr:hypothetical protein [Paenibacillus sedimenti]MBD0379932.1 hypothetical protein [Paenibacillus sedimenti]